MKPTPLALSYLAVLAIASLAAEPEPVFYAPFDDDSPNATIANGAAKASVVKKVSYGPGVRGTAVVCGTSGYLAYPTTQNFDPREGAVSIWMKPMDWEGTDNKFHFIFASMSEGAETRERLLLYKFFNTDQLTVLSDGPLGKNPFIIQKGIDWDQAWHHYALCWTPDSLAVSVDGEELGRTKRREPTATDYKYFLIGTGAFGESEGGHCAYDELRLYDRPLTTEEITALYKKDAAGAKPK